MGTMDHKILPGATWKDVEEARRILENLPIAHEKTGNADILFFHHTIEIHLPNGICVSFDVELTLADKSKRIRSIG